MLSDSVTKDRHKCIKTNLSLIYMQQNWGENIQRVEIEEKRKHIIDLLCEETKWGIFKINS